MKIMTKCGLQITALLNERGMTKKALASYLGISVQSLYNKMYGMQLFTQDEILKIKALFNLSPEQLDDIFFCTKSSLLDIVG